MLYNYITVALRSLRRYRSYMLVNIAGLTLGITCGLLVFLLVRFQFSMDTYHVKADQIYRVVTDIQFGGDQIQSAGIPYPFVTALREEFPEILSTQLRIDHNMLVTIGANGDRPKQKFMLDRELGYAEPEFFKIFDYQWLKGSEAGLSKPFQAVLTVDLAEKYFGKDNPIGQVIRVNNVHDYKVVGLLAEPPANTGFKTRLFLSYESYKTIYANDFLGDWDGVSGNHHCYAVLPKSLQPKQVDSRIAVFSDKHHKDQNKWIHKLQPLSDIHFNPNYGGDVPKALLFALSLVGLFLIGTACINFINLATAQALNRSREVGVRKVLGSSRWQLFNQFLFETGLITFAALFMSLVFIQLALPYMNELLHSKLKLDFSDGSFLACLLGLQLGVTLLAGAYPALVLAGFKPIQAIKGKINTQTLGGYNLRRSLVVVQFVICQLMIITAIVISGQMDYLKNVSLGFNKDAIVMLPIPPGQTESQMAALRRDLTQVPGIQDLSFACDAPSGNTQNSANCRFDTRQEDEVWYINTRPCDEHFLSTFGIDLVAGRNLRASDTIREYLINEATVAKLGLSSPEEAIGKSLSVWEHPAPIVGVIRDFHTRSLHEPIEPVVLMSQSDKYFACGVKIDLSKTGQILPEMDRIWNDVYPDDFYNYAFLDESIARFYKKESAMLGLAKGFCGIALFIGCLGLFGLVSFMAARKRKEIGIRKVLGATVAEILRLFGKEFIRLILIAFALAAPLGWLAMSSWLQDYPYRIPLGASIFLTTIVATLAVALLTVSAQSLKAALANPVNSLRSE